MGERAESVDQQIRSLWQFLALSDPDLESSDIVEMNLIVATEISSLRDLDIEHYCRVVDGWTQQFTRWLPGAEALFHKTPAKWKSDIHFFRVGMLAGFLGHEVGIRYINEQKHARAVRYTNPSDLFLNGLIDTKQGTCANMPTLHVAIARRMGWPVSLACVKSHFISRFDDGQVYHNIEATDTHVGGFASGTDEDYIKRYSLPRKAIACGSDLRKLTAREMLGAFVALRGRHYSDINDWKAADGSYALARVLVPNHRRTHVGAMVPMLHHGSTLFEPGEVGHPDSLFHDLAPQFASQDWQNHHAPTAGTPGIQLITMAAHPQTQGLPASFSVAQIRKEFP